ncbi:MAG: protein kinase [Alphaproteobacteria bacterium]|nr:protein kinase [Alphaproteobacteria bacterium]
MSDDNRISRTFMLPGEQPDTEDPSGPPPEPPRYAIVKELGVGGLGEVHAAQDALLGRTVALKVTKSADPRMRKLFWHEARVTALLDHPNIVPIYDAGTEAGRPFFTMKQIVGKNLVDVIETQPDLSIREKLDIFRAICDAIEYAHAKRWVHRDLKPDNVMLGTFGEVLVVDWGLAFSLDDTRKAPPAGTPFYMPPEQAKGEAPDERVDVYALGGVLWFLLSGEHPWVENEPMVAYERLKKGETFVPPAGRIEHELHAIVCKAVAPDKRDRYRSVRALREDLLCYIDGRPVGAVEYTRAERAAKWADRNRRPLLVGSVLASVVFAALAAAALIAGAGVRRSAVVAQQSADVARSAEARTRAQLVEALLAGANANIANRRFTAARTDLLHADEVTDDPVLGLAWADLTTRGVWPVATVTLEEGADELAVGGSVVLVTYAGGRYETRDIRSLEPRTHGDLPGRPLRILSPKNILCQDGAELVVLDVVDGEVARVALPDGDMRIQNAWKAGNQVVVQAWQDGQAPPARAFSLPGLQPATLPKAVTDLYLHAVGPLGQRVVGSTIRRPELDLPAEVREVATGRKVADLPNARVVLGRDALYSTEGDDVVARALDGQKVLWTQNSRPVLMGSEARRRDVAMADDAGGIFVATAEGELKARLLGLDERPRHLGGDRSGRWLAALGAHGQLSIWGLPESDVDWLVPDAPVHAAAVHPGGRLLATASEERVQIVDLPTGVVIATREVPGARRIELAWSPDGRSLALSTPHLERLDAVTLELTRIHEAPDATVRSGPVVWDASRALQADATGVRVFEPDTLALREDLGAHGVFSSAVALEDGSVVLSAGKRADEAVGLLVPPSGAPRLLEEGGTPDVAGNAVAVLGTGLGIARQDGRLLMRDAAGAPTGEPWVWQGAPLTGLAPIPTGAVAVGLDGRLHVLSTAGELRYSTEFSRHPLDWVQTTPAGLVLGGEDGVRVLPLDGRLESDASARLVHAHAWSLLDGAELSEADRLSVAIGMMVQDGGSGAKPVDAVLGDRTDAEAAILRAAPSHPR